LGVVKRYFPILQDFSKATHPVSFFVYYRLNGYGNVHWQQDICLDNGQTNELLAIKRLDLPPTDPFNIRMDMNMHRSPPVKLVLISRYPMGASKEWVAANEQEIIEWKFDDQNRRIRFERSLF
jgi:hypothetical protein